MTNPVKIGIIGVSGFGENHLKSIAACEQDGAAELVAAVIRNPETRTSKREQEQKLSARGVRIYRDFQEMLAQEKETVELVAIPAGIGSHEKLSIATLRAGYHVICEKPVAGSVEQALAMCSAQKETGKVLAIGYQNIFSPSIQKLKTLRLQKRLGEMVSATSYALWPRHSQYYERNFWAGRIAVDGVPVYDSPAQNAVAHYLNNLLYIAGESRDSTAQPKTVYAENYRAQNIESADTQYIQAVTENEVAIRFTATHAVDINEGPIARYMFDNGYVDWANLEGATKVYAYGPNKAPDLIETFDNGEVNVHKEVFMDTIRAIREGSQPRANIHNSWQHTLCIVSAFKSSGGVHPVPGQYKEDKIVTLSSGDDGAEQKAINTVIPGIADMVRRMYKEEKGFAAVGAPWAVTGKTVDTEKIL